MRGMLLRNRAEVTASRVPLSATLPLTGRLVPLKPLLVRLESGCTQLYRAVPLPKV